jgi:hypothetical protein
MMIAGKYRDATLAAYVLCLVNHPDMDGGEDRGSFEKIEAKLRPARRLQKASRRRANPPNLKLIAEALDVSIASTQLITETQT